MDIFHKHQIDRRPHITNLYHNQPFQTCPKRTNKQMSEPMHITTSNDANKQLEPIVLYKHINEDQRPEIQYVMKTTLSHISFRITNPTAISIQPDPFPIILRTYRRKKRTDAKQHRKKFFILKGLQVLQQSQAYFYFQPSIHYRHIFIEGLVQFRTYIRLRFNETALCQQIHINKGKNSWHFTTCPT